MTAHTELPSIREVDGRKTLLIEAEKLAKNRNNFRLWFSVGCLYGGLIVCFFTVTYVRQAEVLKMCFLPLFIMIGWLQYAIVQAMHEAIHQVSKRSKYQIFLADLLLFYAVGLKPSYRRIHWEHHKFFGSMEHDPDAVVYRRFPHSKCQLLSNLILNFFGLMAVVQLFRQHFNFQSKVAAKHHRKKHSGELNQLLILCLVQLTIAGIISLYSSWLDYVLFWLLPLLTLVKTLSYIRVLAEHGDDKNTHALRSFSGSWAARYLFGPFGFAFHAEHHWFPNVPYYKLPQLSAQIKTTGAVPKQGDALEHLSYSHAYLIYLWFCQLPWCRRKQP